jgi:hypothetical protein
MVQWYRNGSLNNNYRHWMTWTRIHNIYCHIRQRCYDIKCDRYKYYWGRWIKCEWNNFEEFYRDMWETYQNSLTIERIDVNWNYCKENCKWITKKEQTLNKRTSVIIEYNWKKQHLVDWAKELWWKYETLRKRLKKYPIFIAMKHIDIPNHKTKIFIDNLINNEYK